MADDDPYREAPHGHSATLTRLAGRHPAALEIDQAARNPPSDEYLGRLLRTPAPGQVWVGLSWTALILGALCRWIGLIEMRLIVVTGPLVVLSYVARALLRRGWRRRLKARLAWMERLPFPLTGFEAFLVATRPMLDLTFRRPPTAAALEAGVKSHLPGAQVTVIDDRTLRINAPTREYDDYKTVAPLVPAYADDEWLRRFVDEVVQPVHQELGVERLHLGGGWRVEDVVSEDVSEDPRPDPTS